MKEIQRPHIHGAAGKVNAAGRLGNYTFGLLGERSRHEAFVSCCGSDDPKVVQQHLSAPLFFAYNARHEEPSTP
jgi:hypothetical protein